MRWTNTKRGGEYALNKKTLRFRLLDGLYLALIVLPLIAAMALNVLTKPASDGIEIAGARIFFTIPMPVQDLPITESQVNTWAILLSALGLCLFLAHGITADSKSRRHLIAEWVVEKTDSMVHENMGEYFAGFSPFIAAILMLSALSSLLTLIGLYPPTSDLNVVAGWAILVMILITHYKMKGGFIGYLKSFGEPMPALAPLNIISEVATPLSMSFRHYGNVLSGTVISALIAAGLQSLSHAILGWIPGAIGQFPLFQIGLPAVLSVYFDIFSGCMQAFIFAMLTMLYIAGGFPEDAWRARQQKKREKKLAKSHN